MMEPIIPYINFKGEAKQAMEFYAASLKGKVELSQTFGESPMESNVEHKDLIMHGIVRAGDLVIMFSDAIDANDATVRGNSISLSLNFTDLAAQEDAFIALAAGGKISMPLEKTFWGARFGMLVDKFGIHWMFNYDYPTTEKLT